MKLSACIDMIFTEVDGAYADRIKAAANAGASAVEFHLWRDKPIAEVKAALESTGLPLVGLICDPRRKLADPQSREPALADMREALAVAVSLNADTVLATVGPALPDTARAEQRANIVRFLREAASLAEGTGVTIVIEPVNDVDHPGSFLTSTTEGLDIVAEVDHPSVRLLWDIYHSNVMGEKTDVAAGRFGLIRHVQAADFPGRHQPGTGSVDWSAYQALFAKEGYSGYLGLEYRPDGASAASLTDTIKVFA